MQKAAKEVQRQAEKKNKMRKSTVFWEKKKKGQIWFAVQEDYFLFLYVTCSEELNFMLFMYITRTMSNIFHH